MRNPWLEKHRQNQLMNELKWYEDNYYSFYFGASSQVSPEDFSEYYALFNNVHFV